MNTSRPSDLPDFGKPPLVEVALSLQFAPVPGLTTAHIGLLWQKYRAELPLIQEHAPLDPAQENFDPPSPPHVDIVFGNRPPVPRVWFMSEANTELLQIQQDRFIHNWRKTGAGATYPRYERIRDQFHAEVGTFSQFLAEENLGALSINQCEITYVNHIELSAENFGEIENLVSNWRPLGDSAFLPTAEELSLSWRFRIPGEAGRLHVIVQPAWGPNGQRIWMMNLMARGCPAGTDVEAAFGFFDLGREWIVRGFTDLTTDSMHVCWEREDA